jgi:hypothetical protein
MPARGGVKTRVRLQAAVEPDSVLLVRFDGQRLFDGEGTLLAELSAAGRWYSPDGTVARGLAATPGRMRDADTIQHDAAWLREAGEIITLLAERQQHLTSDDVWARVQSKPSESRMMGNAFARAQQARVIARTRTHRPSTRRENHGRPVMVWQSLRHGQQSL